MIASIPRDLLKEVDSNDINKDAADKQGHMEDEIPPHTIPNGLLGDFDNIVIALLRDFVNASSIQTPQSIFLEFGIMSLY